MPHPEWSSWLVSYYEGAKPKLPTSEYFSAQAEVVVFLLSSGTQDPAAADVHGNTVLHYLVGHRVVNEELLRKLRALRGGEEIWQEARNMWGFTPHELYEDGKGVVGEPYKPFWDDRIMGH